MSWENQFPEWRNEGVEPSETLRTNGFQGGQKPPATVFNWFWAKVIKAIAEIQNAITGLANVAKTGSINDITESSAKKFIHIVTASSSDGATYTATVDGLTALEKGVVVTILPSMTATSTTPTLNVNGLGAIQIRRKLSSGTLTRPALQNANTVYKDLPIQLMYDGQYWVATQFTKTSATDLYGLVAVQNGGWYVNSSTTDEDKADALEALGEMGVATTTETWTFTLEDGSTVTKVVYVG